MWQGRFRLLVAYAILTLPTVAMEAVQALQPHVNSPLEWIPATEKGRREYDQFCEKFGSGDIVIVSWDGCTIDEVALDRIAAVLRSRLFYDHSEWLFDRVVSGREMVVEFTRCGLTDAEAIARLRGTLIGPDGRTTCLVVGFTPAGLARRAELVQQIRSAITAHAEVDPESQYLAGPVIDGLTVDLASNATVRELAPLSSAIVLVMAIVCLQCWRTAVIVFCISLYSQALLLACISGCGESVSALLVILPPLIQVLAIACCVHVTNYFRHASDLVDVSDPAVEAVKTGWLPCVLSAGTTAIGMASLMVSDLTPIRSFGAYATVGVLSTTAIILLFLPPLLSRHAFRPSRAMPVKWDIWESLSLVVKRHHVALSLILIVVMMVAGVGLAQIRTSVRIETLFPRDSKIIRDYRWLESNLGPLVPIEVVLEFPLLDRRSLVDQLAEVRQIETYVADHPGVQATLSAVEMIPMLDGILSQSGMGRPSMVTVENDLRSILPRLESLGFLHRDSRSGMHWRVRGFVTSGGQLDYATLLESLKTDIQVQLDNRYVDQARQMTIRTTGTMPLVHRIQDNLMHDLRGSFLLAFVIIAAMLIVLQGSVAGGVLAMIPNVFPTVLLFGSLGWLEIPIDIGSVMTASVALGVAVDDTLHFLTAFQRAWLESKDRVEAIVSAYRASGIAILQTSLICGGGMAAFAISEFLPTARFAWMMMGLFTAALVGDLLLLPCLLLGPLGTLYLRVAGRTERKDVHRSRDAA
jgi:predicted RND superfamily exporter protein